MFSCFHSAPDKEHDAPPQYSAIPSVATTVSPSTFQASITTNLALVQLVTGSRLGSAIWTALPEETKLEKPSSFSFKIERNADRLKFIHLTFSVPSLQEKNVNSPELFIKSLRYYVKTKDKGGEEQLHEDKEEMLIDWNGAALLAHNVSQNEPWYSNAAQTFCMSVLPFVRQPLQEEYIPLCSLIGVDLRVVIEFSASVTGVELIMDGICDEPRVRAQSIHASVTEHANHLYQSYHIWTNSITKSPDVWSARRTFEPSSCTMETSNVMHCTLDRFGDENVGVGGNYIEWLLVYTASKVDTLSVMPSVSKASMRVSGLYAATVTFDKIFKKRNPLPDNVYAIRFEGGLCEQRLESLKLVVQTFDPITEPITVYGMMRGPASNTLVCLRKKVKSS